MVVYENPWFRVMREDGFHFVDEPTSKQGAAVLPLVGNSLWLLQMHRPAQKMAMTLEVPRGYAHEGETSRRCAARELQEEMGLSIDPRSLQYLGKVRPNTAIMTACIDLYVARFHGDVVVGQRDREASGLASIPLERLPIWLGEGHVQDGFTLAALSYYFAAQRITAAASQVTTPVA
ncbi:NUDIX hydrolase [Vreelandella rituensis]|nr:NUDIX hydrolase [Halomonas rituensis]